jgi:hypothetical protein
MEGLHQKQSKRPCRSDCAAELAFRRISSSAACLQHACSLLHMPYFRDCQDNTATTEGGTPPTLRPVYEYPRKGLQRNEVATGTLCVDS